MSLPPEGDATALVMDAYLGFKRGGEDAAILKLGFRDAAGTPWVVIYEGGFSDDTWTGRTLASLANAGWVAAEHDHDLNTIGTLEGRTIDISVKHKPWWKKGRDHKEEPDGVNVNVFINPKRKMEATAAASFAERMKRVIAAHGKGEDGGDPQDGPGDASGAAAGAGAPKSTQAAMAISDDDIPFALLLAGGLSFAFALAGAAAGWIA